MKTILLVTQHFKWMGDHSGFKPLISELSKSGAFGINVLEVSDKMVWEGISGKFRRLVSHRLPSLQKSKFEGHRTYNGYRYDDYFVERTIFRHALQIKVDLVHWMFADVCHGYLPEALSQHKIPLVVTMHWPHAVRKVYGFDDAKLKNISAITSVGRLETIHYSKIGFSGRSDFLQHGVDHSFFKPAARESFDTDPLNVITSGRYLRDYDCLYEICRECYLRGINIVFKILIPQQDRGDKVFIRLAELPTVSFVGNLTDQGLVEFYQRSDLLLMPMISCTANNAILESMACGIPVLTTETTGVYDYTDSTFCDYVDHRNIPRFVEILSNYADNRELGKMRGQLARNHVVQNHSWSVGANQLIDIYKTLTTTE